MALAGFRESRLAGLLLATLGSTACGGHGAPARSPRGTHLALPEAPKRLDLVRTERTGTAEIAPLLSVLTEELARNVTALAKQGKDSDAAWVQSEFNDAWKNADTKLTLEDF